MTVHGFAKLRPTSYKCNLFAASAAPAGRAWTTLPLELGYARITNYISCRWTAHESPPYSLHSRLQRRSLGSGLPTPQPPKLRDLSILFLFRSRSTTTIASFSTSFFSKYKKKLSFVHLPILRIESGIDRRHGVSWQSHWRGEIRKRGLTQGHREQ